ncbi:MAG: ROK family transcriptional regulator, partial [Nocardioides sp.]|nr:ROK family transcriptional regulator [Nocardioides sp.]
MTTTSPVGRPLRPRGKLLQEDARRHHRSLLLQQLFREGPASRADLARTTRLTRVTVSDLVGELVGEGLVEELGAPAEARVGKPPTLVGLAPDASHIIGLDLSADDRMTGAVVNLLGQVQARHEIEIGDAQGEAAVRLVHRLAAELIAMTDRPVLGVGVGSPGVVDAAGTVIDAPNFAWTDTPLSTSLAAALGVPVFVANDANTAVLGEHTFGQTGDGGLMVLRVGIGVGAGLVLG